ncbi:MAG: hypothetical protein ACHQRM_15525 [Bacteroidia bacterium]
MNIRPLILIVLFLLSPFTGMKAQKTPGYRGHKLYMLYDFQFHPDFSHYTPLLNKLINDKASYPADQWLCSHSLGLEYVYNRQSAMGLSAQYMTFQGTYTPESYSYAGSAALVSIYIRHFKSRKAAIAPLGKYQKPELSMLTYNGMKGSGQTSFQSGPQIGFSCSFGRTYILFNHLLIDRGVRFSFSNLYHAIALRDSGKQASDPAAGVVLNNQYFNFYVGIGILP